MPRPEICSSTQACVSSGQLLIQYIIQDHNSGGKQQAVRGTHLDKLLLLTALVSFDRIRSYFISRQPLQSPQWLAAPFQKQFPAPIPTFTKICAPKIVNEAASPNSQQSTTATAACTPPGWASLFSTSRAGTNFHTKQQSTRTSRIGPNGWLIGASLKTVRPSGQSAICISTERIIFGPSIEGMPSVGEYGRSALSSMMSRSWEDG